MREAPFPCIGIGSYPAAAEEKEEGRPPLPTLSLILMRHWLHGRGLKGEEERRGKKGKRVTIFGTYRASAGYAWTKTRRRARELGGRRLVKKGGRKRERKVLSLLAKGGKGRWVGRANKQEREGERERPPPTSVGSRGKEGKEGHEKASCLSVASDRGGGGAQP